MAVAHQSLTDNKASIQINKYIYQDIEDIYRICFSRWLSIRKCQLSEMRKVQWWFMLMTGNVHKCEKISKTRPPGRSSSILVYLWYKICSRALKRGQFWYSPFNFAVRLLSFVNILLWVGGMTRLWSFFMAWAAVDRSGPGSGGRFCRWGQNWFCPLPQGRRSPFWVGERSTHGEAFLNKIKCFWLRQNENLRLRNKKTEPKGLAEN